MSGFWILALVLALAGTAFLIVPLLRNFFAQQEADSRPGVTVGAGIAVALAMPIAALLLYAHWTTWSWNEPPGQAPTAADEAMHSMDQALASLEARLQEDPNDPDGWHMLGRSYMSMRQFEQATNAFRHVLALTEGGNVNTRADYAEALAMSDPEGLSGEAGLLFRELVQEAPQQPKVLWYAGLTEFEAGNEEQGRAYWEQLLELGPPEELRQIIAERLDQAPGAPAAGMPSAGEPAAAGETVAPMGEPLPAEPAAPVAAAEPEPVPGDPNAIRLEVSLDPELAARVPRGAPLFIFARNKGAAGPPLAVIRKSAGDLPLTVLLSDEDAMMAGTRLSDIPELTLVARLALSGSPAAQPGDMFGEVDYSRGADKRTRIVIDQVVP